jgi:methionyl-tRNA formyltransferase
MSILANSRLIFMGMRGRFSLIPFRSLLAAGANISAVIVPAEGEPFAGLRPLPPAAPPPSDLPLLFSPVAPNIIHLAWENAIPVFAVARPDDESLVGLKDLRPNLLCVACFPRLLPPGWLACPPLGCLNLHPSLLPAYRGPAPLFWQFRAGESQTGVTLHFMDEGADTGDIVAQTAPLALPDGITGPEAEHLLAEAGAQLLLDSLRLPLLPRRPQPATSTYQPYPQAADRLISTTWPARRAYNFIRGAAEWGPFVIDAGGKLLVVQEATAFDAAGELSQPYRVGDNHQAWIQFTPGVLHILTIWIP